MDRIKELYKKAFLEFGDSHKTVQWPKGRQEVRFNALTQFIPRETSFSILDFGCGLAHMKDYLDKHFQNIKYTGVDMVEEFIEFNKNKYSNANFMSPDEFSKSSEKFDYIVSSGVFNILYKETVEEHQDEVFRILEILFEKTNIYLASDFMTDRVDFRQPSTYHANAEYCFERISKQFSRRVIINHSYLPYEFCATVYKNNTIKRPENIYE
ncbi:MAG: class I SAM-dependent methyltransferase [Chitinophagia bacterium]|jgi:trans-aconitate methyltransferase